MKAPLQTGPKTSSTAPSAVAPVGRSLSQRKCACGGTPGTTGECEACKRKKMQRREGSLSAPSSIHHPPSSISEAPPIVHEVLHSSGQPLDPETRAFMEPRLGHDFSRVRVHTSSKADESARAVDAQAYTVGRDVVFAAGQYVPATSFGRQLLAHELAHVIQQDHSADKRKGIVVGSPESVLEREAQDVASNIESVVGYHSIYHAPLLQGLSRAPLSLLRQSMCESRPWPTGCIGPGGCLTGKQCIAMQDWPVCGCWDTSGAEQRVRTLVPNWLLALLSVIALLALIACFATGVCEIAIIVGGLGTAAAAALMLILHGLGLGDGTPPTVANADVGPENETNLAETV